MKAWILPLAYFFVMRFFFFFVPFFRRKGCWRRQQLNFNRFYAFLFWQRQQPHDTNVSWNVSFSISFLFTSFPLPSCNNVWRNKRKHKKVPFMAQHVSYICEYSSFASNWYPLKWCFAVFKCSTWLCCCFFRSFIFLVLFNFEFNARWSNYECSFLNKSSFDHIENDEWHKSFDRYFSINSLRRNYYFVFMSLNTHFLNRISQIVNDLRSSES